MPTESNAISFHREDRYNVIKYTDLDKLSHAERRAVSGFLRRIHESVLREGAPARSFLVIESDWPEYEPVWQMIERRMTGQPEVSAAEELDAVLHWRGKHAVAIKERDALQQRLTAADERADVLEGLLRDINDAPGGSQFKKHIDAALNPAPGEPDRINGMIETVGGEYAVMIDRANSHYGWTFKKHPDGQWVSGRKATEREMIAARSHAQNTKQL